MSACLRKRVNPPSREVLLLTALMPLARVRSRALRQVEERVKMGIRVAQGHGLNGRDGSGRGVIGHRRDQRWSGAPKQEEPLG